ncbi:Crp/Fnr family transcriptional regulator [Kitasatospora sp. NBC_01250]|uniref:Crp/Fnr family transcriptional regulator n=1 Tax=Kitasatospora sp. NBC_01250 TaxID=2903571 RepID=UPI002E378FBA|nr:Crp/Fnr family transcriptional regulator [Kitasatospora sp. NBC_01250]
MGDALWDGMLAEAYERRHPIGSTLLRQAEPGTHVLALLAGVAKVIRQERSGDLTLLAFRGPGEVLGEVAVLDDGVRSANVQAISDCSVAVLSKATFLRFVTEHDLFPVMVRYALGRLRESDLARGGGDIVARLSAALVTLAEVSVSTGPQHTGIELALTRDELAQYLGVSRNTVSAGLVELGHRKVHSARKRIVIGDLAALRQLASASRG